jgi:hypothetical protein
MKPKFGVAYLTLTQAEPPTMCATVGTDCQKNQVSRSTRCRECLILSATMAQPATSTIPAATIAALLRTNGRLRGSASPHPALSPWRVSIPSQDATATCTPASTMTGRSRKTPQRASTANRQCNVIVRPQLEATWASFNDGHFACQVLGLPNYWFCRGLR